MKKAWKIILFVCCFISLLSSLQILYNQSSVITALKFILPQIYGSYSWLIIQLLRMLLLLAACVLSFINMFSPKKSA